MFNFKMILILMNITGICATVQADVLRVSQKEKEGYVNNLLPLPHKISVEEKVVIKPGDVSLKLRKNATDVEKNAFTILTALFKKHFGTVPSGNKFEIVIGLLDQNGLVEGITVENASKLLDFPNNDQAYLIQPIGKNKLVITGLNEKGVYYGVITLCQLLSPLINKGTLTVPLIKIEDWPDLTERGFWNGNGQKMVKYLAPLKINCVNFLVDVKIDYKTKKCTAEIDVTKINNARLNAVNCLAKIRHLNFVLPENKAYTIYPELGGKGKGSLPKKNPTGVQSRSISEARVPCAKNPVLKDIIECWIMDLAKKGVKNILIWTTEFYAQCECKDCIREGQFYLEAKAIVEAWQNVRKKYPDIKLRINNSFRLPDKDMENFLNTIPPEIEIGRACYINRTRQEPRDFFSDLQFDVFASKGRWIGSYSLPFMHTLKFQGLVYKDYVKDLLKRNWRGGYILLNTGGSDFNWHTNKWNINALAEWSWNNNGRTVKQFALAYATINGYENPEKFAEWAEIIAPVEYDLYGSSMAFLAPYWFRNIKNIIITGKRGKYGRLGYGYFRYFPTVESFDSKLEQCEKALKIAEDLKVPESVFESKLCLSAVKGVKTVYELICCFEQKPVDKKKMKICLNTIKQLSKEIESVFDERKKILGKKFNRFAVIEARKAGKKSASTFAKWLDSEIK